jgi:hypothetical protein
LPEGLLRWAAEAVRRAAYGQNRQREFRTVELQVLADGLRVAKIMVGLGLEAEVRGVRRANPSARELTLL